MSPGRTVRATVEEFDEDVGLGAVVDEDGVRYRFHCTAISDGTRRIDPGRAVVAEIAAAGPGRWEARRLVSV